MHLIIKGKDQKHYIIKKSDIRRIYSDHNGESLICFNGTKNTPVRINGTVEDFFNIHLAK